MRDEQFDKYRPRIPQGKMWQVKVVDQPSGPVGPLPPTGLTDVPDRSDAQSNWSDQSNLSLSIKPKKVLLLWLLA